MHKRKTKGHGDTDIRSKKRKESKAVGGGDAVINDNSTFGTIVREAGFILKAGNKPNEMSVGQAVFQRRVSSAFRKELDFDDVVQEFMEGLEKHIDNPVRFKWSLMPTVTADDSESVHGKQQDSMMRLLLGLDEVQPKIIKVLLEKLVETNLEEDSIFSQGDCTNVSLSRLVMSQLRWLDNVVNSQELILKIFEMIVVTAFEVQREIITCIPEIVEDKDHAEVGGQLKDLFTENSELTIPILDALSNLYLKQDILADVRKSVLESLPSIDLEAVPVAVKFLMQSVGNNQDAVEVVTELRKNLDFTPNFFSTSSSTPVNPRKSRGGSKEDNRSIEALTLDAIKSAIRFQKSVADAWIKEIIDQLVTHIGRRNPGETDSSMDILVDLVDTQFEKMHPFAVFVKGFLDYMDNLTLSQIRKLYSTLSILGFRNQTEGSVLQDDMFIILRKQLSNNTLKYKRMGIIGTIMVVKSIACVRPNASMDQSDSEMSISEDIYTDVINLLKLAQASCTKMPEVYALFLDELSLIVQDGSLDSKVENWISELAIKDFENHYVVDIEHGQNPEECVVPTEYRYTVDLGIDEPIAVNLLPIIVKAMEKGKEKDSVGSIKCLAPIYRLMRITQYRQNDGDLESIEATLGCPLVMPQSTLCDKMESLNQQEKELICTTIIYAINWMIEIVNAFSNQSDSLMKLKANIRLQNISQLRKILEQCLAATPNFQPPAATFYEEISAPTTAAAAGGKKKAKGKKRKKGGDKEGSGDEDDDDNNSKDSTQLEKETQSTDKTLSVAKTETKSGVDLNQYKNYFRELDIGVFTMLKTNAIQTQTIDQDILEKYSANVQKLQPQEMEFLLLDLTQKLDHALLASAPKRRTFLKPKTNTDTCFTQLDSFGTVAVIQGGVKLLGTICDQLEATSGFFETLLARNDGVVDGPGSRSEESVYMGSCMRLLLQCVLSILSWNCFTMNEHRNLLKEAFTVLASREQTSSTQRSFKHLVKQAFLYFEKFANTIPSIRGAVTLVKLLEVIADRCDAEELNGKITDLCKGFLQQEWLDAVGEKEKGAEFNENLQILLRLYLLHTDSKLECIEQLACEGLRELDDEDKNACSTTYGTLSRNSYAMYYRTLLGELVDCVKVIEQTKAANEFELKKQKLTVWNRGIKIFHILVMLIKAFSGRSNLMSVLKYGRQVIEIFLRHGMPLFDGMFRSHPDDIQGLLKNLQLSTRMLHHICSHSKTVKDVSLTNQVPAMKRCLEAFVYRVKAMLAVNNCREAFWVGNLKNRDLQGEEIISQALNDADDNNETQNDVSDGELDSDEESDPEMDTEDAPNQQAPTRSSKDGSDSDSGGESYSEHF